MARFDFAFDAVQAEFMAITGADTTDLEASMNSNEALIEEAGVTHHSYTAPGDKPHRRPGLLRDRRQRRAARRLGHRADRGRIDGGRLLRRLPNPG
jgi:hypothetical protein